MLPKSPDIGSSVFLVIIADAMSWALYSSETSLITTALLLMNLKGKESASIKAVYYNYCQKYAINQL